jgi:hypothetical protein
MSLLTPLYILGALAIAAPIVFHLIRKSPRGEVPFSSLMFLAPTPPKLTRRSRLENVFLLLLRAAALGLIAFAFARPFLRQAARLDFGGGERRRVAVLLDASASMRRGDLWARAKALADEAIVSGRPDDQLALFAFDTAARPLLGFEESSTLDPSRRRAVAKGQLDRLSPSWRATRLDQALIDAVSAIEDVADASERSGRMPRRVVLITDLQQGSRLEALGDFEWPSDVELEIKTVSDTRANAGPQWLADATGPEPSAPDEALRVRVSNEPGAKHEAFELGWVDEKGSIAGKPVGVYVPPGESRVVRVPPPADPSRQRSLRLTGDGNSFDNTLYLASGRKKEDAAVLYVGPDAPEDPSGLLYYVQRVFPETPQRSVRIVQKSPASPLALEAEGTVPLIILASETTPENAGRLRAFLRDGGTVLDVATAPGRSATLAALSETPEIEAEDAKVDRDVMLGEIAFDHPLFASLSGAQFNDFTKIRFWKYRRLADNAIGQARVLARFENGDAAVIEKPVGKGRLVVFASGWGPGDSQLARSSKFVPLMAALLEGNAPPFDVQNILVGDKVPLPASSDPEKGLVVHKPDGATVAVEPGAESFAETDQPGVYTIDTPDGPRAFAANLDPAESRTSPLSVETLEQFGCRLASHAPKPVDGEQKRQMQNAELEGRQKLWRWLILAAVGVLIVETWLAGRLARPRPARAEALAT